MNLANEFQKLNDLKESGALSEQEYQRAKEILLTTQQPVDLAAILDVNTWCVFIHLSQFMAYLLPLAGIIVPLILWQLKKDHSEIVDRHGKIVMNWILTEFTLLLVIIPLCFILVGLPLLLILSIIAIVFPIIGTVKASGGQLWPYPCSIKFFK